MTILNFKVIDYVFLKVQSWYGMIHFGIKGKLVTQYIRLFWNVKNYRCVILIRVTSRIDISAQCFSCFGSIEVWEISKQYLQLDITASKWSALYKECVVIIDYRVINLRKRIISIAEVSIVEAQWRPLQCYLRIAKWCSFKVTILILR